MQDLMIFLSKSLLSWLGMQACFTLVFLWYLKTHNETLVTDDLLPKTAVILCLRGADPFLPHCLRSLMRQNFPNYDLKLIFDSQEDPAWRITTEAIAETGATNVQLSTLNSIRHNCSLKCSALVQAISDLDKSYTVVALVDADTITHPNWLRELVAPLSDPKVGATTGNRWYSPTGKYWGSLVRYAGNVATIVQMFLFGVPWGGTLAIKTEVLHQTELLNKWGEAFSDDLPIPNLLKKQRLKIKFVPSLIMVNREECDLASFFGSLQRFMTCARLYHPRWLALVSEAISSILFPTLVIGLILESLLAGDFYPAALLFTCYFTYTVGLLLLMLAMELSIQQVTRNQGQVSTLTQLTPSLIGKMLIIIPFTQWFYGIAMISSLWESTIKWRGLSYHILSRWNVRLVAYRPYQWLDQPIDPKISL